MESNARLAAQARIVDLDVSYRNDEWTKIDCLSGGVRGFNI